MAKQRTAPNPNIALNLAWLMQHNNNKAVSTQQSLSERSGVGQTTIGRILRGEVNPQGVNLKKLSDALGCEVGHLFIDHDSIELAFNNHIAKKGLEARDAYTSTLHHHTAGEKVNDEKYISNTHRILIELFESLPESEQNQLIRALEEKKQHFQNLFDEMMKKRVANGNVP